MLDLSEQVPVTKFQIGAICGLFYQLNLPLCPLSSVFQELDLLLVGGGWTVKSSGWEQVPFTPQGNLPARVCRQLNWIITWQSAVVSGGRIDTNNLLAYLYLKVKYDVTNDDGISRGIARHIL